MTEARVDSASIVIVGTGKAAWAIAGMVGRSGLRITAVAGRDEIETERLASFVGGGVAAVAIADAAAAAEVVGLADVVILAVSDRAIRPVCEELARAGAFKNGAIVAHLSGALSSDVLVAAREKCRCRIASAHPLQTFAKQSFANQTFADIGKTGGATGSRSPSCDESDPIYWFIEGDDEAVSTLSEMVVKTGGVPGTISGAAKAGYHAASVIACNYLITLMDAATQLMSSAGVHDDAAWRALSPLVSNTICNIDDLGPAGALTGPIERGDVETVRSHVRALSETNAELLDIYRVMGRHTIELALKKGSIDERAANALSAELSESGFSH